MTTKSTVQSIDAYIAAQPPNVAAILEKIRRIVREAAPEAVERVSYRMPAFSLDSGMLIYFAGFKEHIGMYPPLRGEAKLDAALAPYRGEKGNLKFPLDRPMPYALIARVVKARLKQQRDKAAAQRRRK